MFCEGGDADDVMGPGRRLDGHEGHSNSIFATNSTIAVIDEDGRGEDEGDMMTECLRAFRLLDQIDEYTDKDTTEERKDEITEQWSEAIDDAWSEMFSSDSATSTFAASVAGLATAVTLLSFWASKYQIRGVWQIDPDIWNAIIMIISPISPLLHAKLLLKQRY